MRNESAAARSVVQLVPQLSASAFEMCLANSALS